MRFCRRVNAITKKDVYLLPIIDDTLDTLDSTKYLSTLDLCSGYWQIELYSVTRDKSAFTTHCGLFEFTRMPFGLCNAPASFGSSWVCLHIIAGFEKIANPLHALTKKDETYQWSVRCQEVFDLLKQKLKGGFCVKFKNEFVTPGWPIKGADSRKKNTCKKILRLQNACCFACVPMVLKCTSLCLRDVRVRTHA